jgi:hypothetical protein
MPASPERLRYDYAILRVVPRVERGECMNVGVVVWCPQARFLAMDYECRADRLLMLDPALDVATLEATLAAFRRHCDACQAGGHAPTQVMRQTFDFLVAARSTVLQVSPVHAGFTTAVQQLPAALMDRFVRV